MVGVAQISFSGDQRDKSDILESIPILKTRSPANKDEAVKNMHLKRYDNGQLLFQRGEIDQNILFVIDGCINLTLSSADGREVIFRQVFSGDSVGLYASQGSSRFMTNGLACMPTSIYSLSRRVVFPMIEQDVPKLEILNDMAEQIRESIWIFESLSICRLEARLARVILQLAEKRGVARGEIVEIPFPFSQSHLAKLANGSRPKINFQLRKWMHQGIIAVDRAAITINNIEFLTLKADCG